MSTITGRPAWLAPDGLSEREAVVLGLVALGHTNQEIAEKLTVNVRTVDHGSGVG